MAGEALKGRPSNNPHGRPRKAQGLTDLYRKYLDAKDPGDKVARKQRMVEELHRRAMGGWVIDPDDPEHRVYVRGSDDLLKYAFDRVDGKPVQAIEHSGPDAGPMEVNLPPDVRDQRILELLGKLGVKQLGDEPNDQPR